MLFTIMTLFLFINVLALEEKGTFTELQQLIDNNSSGEVKLEKDYEN